MRTTILAALLTALSVSASAEAPPRGGSRPTGGESERAIRAEMRSRAVLGQVCRGCGPASEVRPRRRRATIAIASPRGRFRGRGTSLYAAIPPLPLTSRTEWYVHGWNRAQAQNLQWLQFQQQTQFELNQLRGALHRHYLFH
jgi:hypothetical protein